MKFIIEDGVLLKYYGNEPVVSVPSNVKVIGKRAFACSSPVEVIFNEGLERIEKYAFSRGRNLKKVSFAKVKHIENHAFWMCDLEEIVLSDDTETIEAEAFSYNKNLKSVILPKKLKSIDSTAFLGCALESMEISPENPYFATKDNLLFSKDMKKLIIYPMGKSEKVYNIPAGVEEIAPYGFSDSKNLEKVVYPEGLVKIGDFAFRNCYNLKSVVISASVKHIGDCAFRFCKSLRDVEFEGETFDYFGAWLFDNCYTLERVKLPQIEVLDGTFCNCYKLKEVVFPKTLKEITWLTFNNCKEFDVTGLNIKGRPK